MSEYKAGVSLGIAPKNNTGNSKSALNFGCVKKRLIYEEKEFVKSIDNKPFNRRTSMNSVNFMEGLYTKSFIPTSYLYLASLRNSRNFNELPGSRDSNIASNSPMVAGMSEKLWSAQYTRYDGSSRFNS